MTLAPVVRGTVAGLLAFIVRGTVAGLLAFIAFGFVFGRVQGALALDEWSVDALGAVGLAAVAVDAAVGGVAGAWQSGLRGRAAIPAAVPGPLLGAPAIVAASPDGSLETVMALLVIIAAAAAGGFTFVARVRRHAY